MPHDVMQPPTAWRHAGAVVARALVPIAGVLFLHWSAANLLIVYFADTLAAFFAVSVLAAGRLSGGETPRGPAWYQRLATGARLASSGAMITLLIGLVPFGFLVFMLLMQDFVWQFALHDRDLWIGVAAQFCAAVTLLLREYRHVEAATDADRIIRARFGLVFMRWVIVCMVFFAAAELLQPQRGGVLAAIFGFVLVLAYAATTIAMELQPSRLLGAFAPDLVARGEAPSAPAAEKRRPR
ncbi:MAG TPA: DUF6498-containing protein [Casimicrobiaceae bacterium]|nr:DUF6498-containing protein [Casimicrobiaceae bacterium]